MTPTSYIVLGLLERYGPGSAYDLKRRAADALGNFWATAHSQLYRTAEQLARDGHIEPTTESTPGGRNRIVYRLAPSGRNRLEEWREQQESELAELRDPALLKLYFGANPATLAEVQAVAHRRQLAAYEQRRATDTGDPPRGPWLTLEAGIAHERVWIQYWEALAKPGDKTGGARGAEPPVGVGQASNL